MSTNHLIPVLSKGGGDGLPVSRGWATPGTGSYVRVALQHLGPLDLWGAGRHVVEVLRQDRGEAARPGTEATERLMRADHLVCGPASPAGPSDDRSLSPCLHCSLMELGGSRSVKV